MSEQVIAAPAAGWTMLAKVPRWAGAGSVVLGVAALAGWAWDNNVLKRVGPGLPTVRPVTAVCLILLGVALVSVAEGRRPHLIGGLTATAAAGVAAASLLEEVRGWDLLVKFPNQVEVDPNRGRMAPATAVQILVIVAGLLAHSRGRHAAAQVLGLVSLAGSTTALLSFTYGAHNFYAAVPRYGMSLQAALGIVLLSTGLLAAVPGGLLHRITTSAASDCGTLLLRRLLPMVFLVLPLVGWLQLQGELRGWYGAPFGVAIMAIVGGALFCVTAWWAAALADHSATLLRNAWRRLGETNAALETRIRQRDGELADGQAWIRGLLEALPSPVVLVQDERIVLANRKVRETLGYGGDELVDEKLQLLLPDWPGVSGNGANPDPGQWQLALEARHKDGRLITVEVRLSTTPAERGPLVTVAICGVTDRSN